MSQHVLHSRSGPPLSQRAERVSNREEFLGFLHQLVAEGRSPGDQWENTHLASYLDALARWTRDMDGYFKGRGEPMPEDPTWRLLAQMLLAATIYE